jgi:hypothetical protein
MFDKDFKATAEENNMVTTATSDAETEETRIGAMPVDLARVGLNEIAYIRQAIVNDEDVWAIFNAAGDPIGAAPTFDQAWGAVRQHDMEPTRVH